MKKFEFKIIDNETSRVVSSVIEANSIVEARILIRILYRTDEEISKLIGVPKEIVKEL